ncbi:hypothetical protein D3C81_584030 [compost metagenome]
MAVSALRIDDGDAVRKLVEPFEHLILVLGHDEAGQLDVPDMNQIDDPALDEDTQHGVQRGIPALHEAKCQDDDSVHDEQHCSHRHVTLAGNDGAQNVEAPGRTSGAKREANASRDDHTAKYTGEDRVLGHLNLGNNGQEPGGRSDTEHA